ncbi:hypothetical protein SAMN06265171_10413 [Chryseobacterium rhizoplanae]|uniref:Uncharacterized protein n=1 Tax=Chryseobacterium rhizoplanae TaxID=1609531 RepID=A0A521CZ05_9FLAO|nr:hypothetical protein [Chryseobacterium rhizoplanae]SMO64642.1 hypothetical protein SAMN06265171_10413 [Chryseobacterium rhizoplanae]
MLGGNADATEDYEELGSLINEYEIQEIVGGFEMELIFFYFYGILIILLFIRSDQENLMVYRTDHEVYFQKFETKEAWKIF